MCHRYSSTEARSFMTDKSNFMWHTTEHAQTEATCRREVLQDDMDEKRISPCFQG